MAHTFWRGEHIVIQRLDGTADIYAWESEGRYGHYTWLGDYASTDEAEHYVREMEALPEFPEIKPVTTPVVPVWPKRPDGSRQAKAAEDRSAREAHMTRYFITRNEGDVP